MYPLENARINRGVERQTKKPSSNAGFFFALRSSQLNYIDFFKMGLDNYHRGRTKFLRQSGAPSQFINFICEFITKA
jgi:hypothetical protein